MTELEERCDVDEVVHRDLQDRQALVQALEQIGVRRGILVKMAKAGQILELRCETPKCYCPKGRQHFPRPPLSPSKWEPTIDHYPILKTNGGKRDPWNIRLAHRLCNREDYGWRARINRMIKDGNSLAEIAETLNRLEVGRPHGSQTWTPANVRRAYVA